MHKHDQKGIFFLFLHKLQNSFAYLGTPSIWKWKIFHLSAKIGDRTFDTNDLEGCTT